MSNVLAYDDLTPGRPVVEVPLNVVDGDPGRWILVESALDSDEQALAEVEGRAAGYERELATIDAEMTGADPDRKRSLEFERKRVAGRAKINAVALAELRAEVASHRDVLRDHGAFTS